MKRRLLLSFAALMISFGLGHTAFADSFTFTLSNPNQVALPGQTISFTATLSAPSSNGNNFFVNGDSFSPLFPIAVDDSPFLNFPFPFFLSPGQSYTSVLFNVMVAPNAAVGSFINTFTLLGGSTQNDESFAASANFTVTVTPEPSSWLLMGTGLVGIFVFSRRTSVQDAIRSTLS